MVSSIGSPTVSFKNKMAIPFEKQSTALTQDMTLGEINSTSMVVDKTPISSEVELIPKPSERTGPG